MISALFFLTAGLTLLVVGGEALLRGAVASARLLRIAPALVGLIIVGAVTSVPELAVSLSAAFKGSSDIAVGNVVGSNIANLTLILGLSALISGLAIGGQTIKLEYPVLLGVTWLFVVLTRDGVIDAFDGSLFLLIYVLFTIYMVGLVRGQMNQEEEKDFSDEVNQFSAASPSRLYAFGFLALGVVLLWSGAELAVTGAVKIASYFGMSDRVIGLTIVAVGTSLPEIVAGLLASIRGRDDVAVGNVLGSNLFNILFILGLTSLFQPIPVNPAIVSSDNWWLVGTTILLFPLMFSGLRISRLEGGLLVAAYVTYVVILLA